MFDNIDYDALIDDIVNKTESPIVIIKAQLKIGVKDQVDIKLASSELKELLEGGEDAAREYLRAHLRSILQTGPSGKHCLEGVAQNSSLTLANYFVNR